MDVKWSYLGVVPFSPTLELMERLRQNVENENEEDHILLLQHSPVITRGNSDKGKMQGIVASEEEIRSRGFDLVDADRGGKVTIHTPGQLVGYVVVNLKRRKLKVKKFVEDMIHVLAMVLDSYGIDVVEDQNSPGLFVNGKKIAFLGFSVKHNVTSHGFALNVNNDLRHFDMIVPCGLENVEITSMENEIGKRFSLFDVYWRVITCFADMFDDQLEEVFFEDFE